MQSIPVTIHDPVLKGETQCSIFGSKKREYHGGESPAYVSIDMRSDSIGVRICMMPEQAVKLAAGLIASAHFAEGSDVIEANDTPRIDIADFIGRYA